MKIIVGITGSIAAYKTANIVSLLKKQHCDVHVVMTKSATKFISPITFEVLSQNKVFVDMFLDDNHTQVDHINLSKDADAFLVAPASYNIIGKIANGIADDMLTTMVSAYTGQIYYASAMNTNMYENPIFKKNCAKLKALGHQFISPKEGILACGDEGNGKLQDEQIIVDTVLKNRLPHWLAGKNVLVTAGATREYIDPIRYITNTSSGKMGVALAQTAKKMGANVTLITGNTPLAKLQDIQTVVADTSEDMKNSVLSHFPHTDIVIMTAAVGDYRPKIRHTGKMKKQEGNLSIEMERTTDILKTLGEQKTHQMLIGFAAESTDLLTYGRGKLEKKNLDYIVINNITNFATDTNTVTLLSKTGEITDFSGLKIEIANRILEKIFKK